MDDMKIAQLWPTPFWLGQFEINGDASKLTDALQCDGPLDVTHLRASLSLLSDVEQVAATVAGPGEALFWTHRLERWQPGHQLGFGYQSAAVWALAILESAPPADHPLSGEIRLHDPRTGAANVALPGLPWGRPVTFPAVTGALVAIPGWLPVSIAPVRHGHSVTVWTALGHRNASIL